MIGRRLAALVLALVAVACRQPIETAIDRDEWKLYWSDEFNGPAGAPDTTRWRPDTADGCQMGVCGWGNEEKQFYTGDSDNVRIDGTGNLAITASVGGKGRSCYYGPCRYTSGKLTTRGRVAFSPGLVEARIKVPTGQGLWPAFWMLGFGYPATPWPDAGELDIMESKGSQKSTISSAIHGPGYSGNTPIVDEHTLARGQFADGYHLFAVAWDSSGVRFYVDDALHYAVPRSVIERHGPWVFDGDFFVLLNLAVGGKFDGDPASDAVLPATMLVDYVRAYRRTR